jgi:hypothetical protein
VDQALRAASKQLEDKIKKERKSQVRTAGQLFMAVSRSFAKPVPEAGGTSALGDAGSIQRAKEKGVDADESSESGSSSDSSFDDLEAEVCCRPHSWELPFAPSAILRALTQPHAHFPRAGGAFRGTGEKEDRDARLGADIQRQGAPTPRVLQ